LHRELRAAPVDAITRRPEDRVLPRRDRRHSPGAERPPVVGDIPGEYRVPLVEGARSEGLGVIPAVPKLAGPELLGFPAQVLLLHRADLVRLVADELSV